MQWSRLKKRYKGLLADSLRGKLDIHVTEYREVAADVGRAWITFNGEEVVSIAIPAFYDEKFNFSTDTADLGRALGFIAEKDIEQLKCSDDPVIKGLTFLDRRVGKRFLQGVEQSTLHPFSQILYRLRCHADNIKC